VKLRALALAVALTLAPLLAVTVSTAPAQAGSGIFTYNRPSTVEAGGAEYIAWDDQCQPADHPASAGSGSSRKDS